MTPPLDAIIVLGGESTEKIINGKLNPAYRSRSRIAAREWWKQYTDCEREVSVICTGNHNTFTDAPPPRELGVSNPSLLPPDIASQLEHDPTPPEALATAEYLCARLNGASVPKQHIRTETRSRDTLGNIYFSYRHIDDAIRSQGRNATGNIGIVSEDAHLDILGLWAGERLLPEFNFIGIGTGVPLPPAVRAQMHVMRTAIELDMKLRRIPHTSFGAEEYFNCYHPIHAKENGQNPGVSAYGTLISLKKNLKIGG